MDVAVIGGGIVGCALAAFLAVRVPPKLMANTRTSARTLGKSDRRPSAGSPPPWTRKPPPACFQEPLLC